MTLNARFDHMTMRKLSIFPAALSLLLSVFVSTAAAQVTVQIPSGEIDPKIAVPINIRIPSDGSISAIEIFGNSGRYIRVSIPPRLKITEIMTRFMPVDSEVAVTSFNPDGKKSHQIFRLNLSIPSVVPKESKTAERQISSIMMKFEPNFTGYEIRRRPEGGQVLLIVRNSASMTNFVEKVSLSFVDAGDFYPVTVEGSPFWFEPFIGFRGTFSDVSVTSVSTN